MSSAGLSMLRRLLRAYDWVIAALAIVAAIIMLASFCGIIADVSIRDFGYQSPRAIQPLIEFGLPYIACDLIAVLVLMYVPALGTWLPSLMQH
jgi:hypothetical protein